MKTLEDFGANKTSHIEEVWAVVSGQEKLVWV